MENSKTDQYIIEAVQVRKVSFLLGTGIVLMPYLFSWFTLRKGYSTQARVVSIGWLVVIFLIFSQDKKSTTATTSISPPSLRQPITKVLNAKAFAGLSKKVDKMEGATFYQAPGYSNDISRNSAISAYLGTSGNQIWMRVFLTYKAEDWLFIKGYKIMADDIRFDFELPVETKVGEAGYVYEWTDAVVDEKSMNILRVISKAKKVVIRSNGRQFYKDRIVSKGEKDALAKILRAYDGALTQ